MVFRILSLTREDDHVRAVDCGTRKIIDIPVADIREATNVVTGYYRETGFPVELWCSNEMKEVSCYE